MKLFNVKLNRINSKMPQGVNTEVISQSTSAPSAREISRAINNKYQIQTTESDINTLHWDIKKVQ